VTRTVFVCSFGEGRDKAGSCSGRKQEMLMMAAQAGAGHEVLYMSCNRQLFTVYSGYWGEGNVDELSGQEYQRAGLRVLR
jgi:hypothetical protein